MPRPRLPGTGTARASCHLAWGRRNLFVIVVKWPDVRAARCCGRVAAPAHSATLHHAPSPRAQVFLTDEHLCIVMEYANGGSLFNMVCGPLGARQHSQTHARPQHRQPHDTTACCSQPFSLLECQVLTHACVFDERCLSRRPLARCCPQVRTQRRLKESMARWFFQQLILAVDYCHKRGVANRDIKLVGLGGQSGARSLA